MRVTVYDASTPQLDGGAGRIGDAREVIASGPDNAAWAATNVQKGLDWYQSAFGRNGIDGRGGNVSVVVNDYSRDKDNKLVFEGNGGYYATRLADGSVAEALRFGPGTEYRHANGKRVAQYEMQVSDDLTIHELTHGVIRHETGLLGGGSTEAGATHEALADIMAASATRDWRIGEGMYKPTSEVRMMRNIANPYDASALHPLARSIQELGVAWKNGEFEEHAGSGVISTPIARMQQRLGGEYGWNSVASLTYRTITSAPMGDMSFRSVASALRGSATTMWGPTDERTRVLEEELRASGL